MAGETGGRFPIDPGGTLGGGHEIPGEQAGTIERVAKGARSAASVAAKKRQKEAYEKDVNEFRELLQALKGGSCRLADAPEIDADMVPFGTRLARRGMSKRGGDCPRGMT